MAQKITIQKYADIKGLMVYDIVQNAKEKGVILPEDPEYVLDDSEMHKHFEDSIGMVSDWRKRGHIYEVPFRSLYNKEVNGKVVIDDDIKARIDAYYDQYGVK